MAINPCRHYNTVLGGKVVVRWQRSNYRRQRIKSPQNLIIALLEIKKGRYYSSNTLINIIKIYTDAISQYER
jgi:hypothetical protein